MSLLSHSDASRFLRRLPGPRMAASVPVVTPGRPAGVDLIDDFAAADQVLGETAAVAPSAFDAPLSGLSQSGRPGGEVMPPDSLLGPCQSPTSLPARRRRAPHPCSVSVYSDGDHLCPTGGIVGLWLTGLSRVLRPAPIRSSPCSRHAGGQIAYKAEARHVLSRVTPACLA